MSQILFFDGECILCNKSIQYIIKHDKDKLFKFAHLQSPFGQSYLKKLKLDQSPLSTIIYISNSNTYTKSTAVIRAFSKLGGWRKTIMVFLLVPEVIRNLIYDLIAKNRKLFFKNETCTILNVDIKERIIDSNLSK